MKTEEHSNMIEFVEYRDKHSSVRTVDAFITRPGGNHVLVARIERRHDPKSNKLLCRTYDMDGKEELAPTFSLKVAKQQIERQENYYLGRMQRQEEAKRRGMDEFEMISEEMGKIEEETMRLGREFGKTPEYKKLMCQAKLKQIRASQTQSQSRTR